ncbi:ABC transporter substrate-binding protein [Thiotrichales bacterium 19S9-11]|nr:ABC transporter substrate-binding protein [Thiotrichales bacterium 19S9-11]
MKKKLLSCVIFVLSFIWLNTAKAVDIITLAPNITLLLQSIVNQAELDGTKHEVKIIATVHYYNEPKSVRLIPSIGDAFNIQVEKIILLKPDLVLTWEGGTSEQVVQQLKGFKLKVYPVEAQSIKAVALLIIRIGKLVGLEKSAQKLARDYLDRLEELKPSSVSGKKVFVQLSDRPLYTIGAKGFMSEIIAFCGAKNIFEEVNQEAFEVSRELVLLKNPDVILITQNISGGYKVLKSSYWKNYSTLNAVKNNQIYAVNSSLVSQATLSLLEGIQLVCKIINTE